MEFETGFVVTFCFLIGLACGSFLNALEYRLKRGQSVMWNARGSVARSACPHCHRTLRVWDLIPVVSYLWRRGRCFFCGKPIHWQYPAIELAAGVICAAAAWRFGATIDTAITAAFGLTLLFIFLYDLKHQLILDAVTLPLIPIAALLSIVRGYSWQDLLLGTAVGGGFFAFQYAVSRGRWIGGGDIRLGIVMGVMLGFQVTIAALFIAYIGGALIALYAIARKKLQLQSRMPFGTCLAAATVVCLLWGREMVEWYVQFLV